MEVQRFPQWAFQGPPMNINPLPSTFTDLITAHGATNVRAAGVEPKERSWTTHLAAPNTHTRLPAWTRLPIQPYAGTHVKHLIMKRIDLFMGKPTSIAPSGANKQETSKSDAVEQAVEEVPNLDRQVRAKNELYQKVEGDAQFQGKPLSQAEIAHLVMAAKVVTCNNYMETSTSLTFQDRVDYRKGIHIQVCPMKRYFDFDEPNGKKFVRGNKLTFYDEVLPIIQRACAKGMDEVNMTFATIAETSSIMKGMRRDPRQYLASNGAPDLSDIADMTEPESPHFVRAPTLKAESRSPSKRIAKLTSPIKHGFQRISQTFVKLAPASSSKRSTSPTKSISAPSTPIRLSPTPVKSTVTAMGINSSPSSRGALIAPVELSPAREDYNPLGLHYSPTDDTATSRDLESSILPFTGLSKVPSYVASPLSDSKSSVPDEQSLPEQTSSPVKHSRPVAPTPSRWNRAEPSTPKTITPVRSMQSKLDGIVGISSLAPATPRLPMPYKLQTPEQASSINFGDVSPAFNSSISFMNASVQASEAQRVNNLRSARRRQSEPLQRTVFKMNARRQSGSPVKVTYQGDDGLYRPESPLATLFSAYSPNPKIQSNNNTEPIDGPMHLDEQIPAVTTNPDDQVHTAVDAYMSDESTHVVEYENRVASDTAPVADGRNDGHGVLNIDMRENPDIFGPHMSSPRYEAIRHLADMASNNCADHANVQVTQERGRLVVRFKLPTKYAHLFPDTQGMDEKSLFSTSPSMSNSPRIRFPSPQMSRAIGAGTRFGTSSAAASSISPEVNFTPQQNSEAMDMDIHENDTIGMDWAKPRLPSHDSHQSPWGRAQHPKNFEQDATLVLYPDFGSTPNHGESSMQTPSRHTESSNTTLNKSVLDNTAAVNEIFAPALLAINNGAQSQPELPSPAKPFQSATMWTPTRPGDCTEMPTPSRLLEGVSDMPSPSIWGGSVNATPAARLTCVDTPMRDQDLVNDPPQQVEAENSTTLSVLEHTPTISGLGIIGVSPGGIQNTPSQNGRLSISPSTRTPLVRTPNLTQSDQGSSPMFGRLTRSAKPLSPIQETPVGQVTSAVDQAVSNTTPAVLNFGKIASPNQQTPTQIAQPEVADTTPTPTGDIKSTKVKAPAASPFPKSSFTPVNQPTPKVVVTAPSNASSPTSSAHKSTQTATVDAATDRPQDYDSPGRDYMRDFIKRARPKQPSTTETGSPIAPLNKRLPLEAKSPNASSPQKNKRKVGSVEENGSTAVKSPKERAPKRLKRQLKPKQKEELAIDLNDVPPSLVQDAPARKADDVTNQDDTADIDNAPSTRRSTRLRTQKGASSGSKSSIPTSIKLNRSGAGRAGGAVLNSMVRNVQQELTNQTRLNTRNNKGNSEYPKQVLAKFADPAQADESDDGADVTTTTKSGKSVGWKDPLESVQGEQQPKRSKATTKATLGKSGIAKPKTTSKTASQTKRTTKLAENLGMVANGTPAKPQRMTRSRTRSQQS